MSNLWLQKIATHQKHGEHKDILANTSEENLDYIWHRWVAFCDEAGLVPEATLATPDAATIKTFFDFTNQNGTAQIISNQTYFRRLKQHIKRIGGQDLDTKTCRDVNAYIRHHLGGQKEASPRERPVAAAEDFIEMLHFLYLRDTTYHPDERQRVQEAFLMQIMAYSALRPSSTTAAKKRKRGLGESGKSARQKRNATSYAQERIGDDNMTKKDDKVNEDEEQCAMVQDDEARLKYGDFRLFLMLDEESNQTRLCIQPQYKHYKGERRRLQMKTFTYWTLPYVLACPAATLLALALHDGALAEISTLDDLLKLHVTRKMGQLELYWSEEWRGRCIMRESIRGEMDKELSSAKARYRLVRLGKNMGLQYRLLPYCLRRFCLNLLSVKVGAQVRRHVAGHVEDETYEAHYADQRIGHDVANVVLGNRTEERLTAKLHRMTAGADPSINGPIPQEVYDAIKTTPDMIALLARRDKIKGALSACECEDILQTLREQQKECTGSIRALKQRYKEKYRLGHFERKNRAIVRAQLDGHDFDAVTAASQAPPLPKETCLPERLYLGGLEAKFPTWSPAVNEKWAQGLRAMLHLCARMERRTENRDTEVLRKDLEHERECSVPGSEHANSDDAELYPYKSLRPQCLFCLGDERLPYGQRTKDWKPAHVLWRHVSTQHLKKLSSSEQISCPHPVCRVQQVVLKHKAHFLNHAQTAHNVRLQK